MTENLKTKIDNLDIQRPYVWELGLSETDFCELESCIKETVEKSDGKHDALLSQAWAKRIIVYLAEWYRRCYQGRNTNNILQLDSNELQKVWTNSGIHPDVFVYADGRGNRRWLYSIYVLGGLATRHEMNRNDSNRFLKSLCRIYHGEDIDISNMDNDERAVAFRESIRRKHSLYYYIQALLLGKIENKLSTAIRTANDETYREKFELECLVNYSSKRNFMTRWLRLWLKPEELGGLHQYLRFDRVRLWGIDEPENKRMLRAALRFMNGTETVSPPDWDNPLLIWYNTGDMETGFVSLGVERYAPFKRVPSGNFTSIEIWIRDDDGKAYKIQTVIMADCLQLWKSEENDYCSGWSSRTNNQQDTAVLFTDEYKLIDEQVTCRKPFRDWKGNNSQAWCWKFIENKVCLIDSKHKECFFYNRSRAYILTTRLYKHILQYEDETKVLHYYFAEEDDAAELLSEQVPLIWKKDDIKVEEGLEAGASNAPYIEKIEFQKENGRYTEWDEANDPAFGILNLRLTIQGKTENMRVAYLAGLGGDEPIIRDLVHNEIKYVGGKLKDNIEENGIPLEPTVPIKLGTDRDYVLLNVWRPTDIKEIVYEGRVIKYARGEVRIPYIVKDDLSYNDFGKHGYLHYDCQNLKSIYPMLGRAANASLQAWKEGCKFAATDLDEFAPPSLSIVLGNSETDREGMKDVEFYYWDYDKDTDPEKTEYDRILEKKKTAIIFQSLKEINRGLTNIYPKINNFPFERNLNRIDYVKCFEVAAAYRLYFFMFWPFTKLVTEKDIQEKVIEPLEKNRGGQLTDRDKKEIERLREELSLRDSN